jgi:hypothetical protein
MVARRPPDSLKAACTAQEWRFATQPGYAREVILERDGAICAECGDHDPQNWELDHRVALHTLESLDITHWLAGNSQTLCRRCHHRKSAAENKGRAKNRRLQRQRQGKPKQGRGFRRKVDGTVIFEGEKKPWEKW